MQYLSSSQIKNKTILLRVDVNEPIAPSGQLADDFRIKAILPTLKWLSDAGCKIVLCGHVGRPKSELDKHLTMKPIALHIAELLSLKYIETKKELPEFSSARHLIFYNGNIEDPLSARLVHSAKMGDMIVLENLRFYKGESENSPVFAKRLADLADIYVNDAFAVSHRNNASVVGVTEYLPSYAGLLMEKELKQLSILFKNPESPFTVMMGGIKISDKAETLTTLGRKADHILVGGGVANLLIKASGYEVGQSKIEESSLQTAKEILRNFKDKLILPQDVVVANQDLDPKSIKVKSIHEVSSEEAIFDVGPKTILQFSQILKGSKTIAWNGPLGFFEHKPFHTATLSLARVIGGQAQGRAFAVVGGGETVDAVRRAHQEEMIDHVSTGGGAMLEYLAGNTLPGIESLEKQNEKNTTKVN